MRQYYIIIAFHFVMLVALVYLFWYVQWTFVEPGQFGLWFGFGMVYIRMGKRIKQGIRLESNRVANMNRGVQKWMV